jgi:hypothetical protein
MILAPKNGLGVGGDYRNGLLFQKSQAERLTDSVGLALGDVEADVELGMGDVGS